jgi:hypothetical protein
MFKAKELNDVCNIQGVTRWLIDPLHVAFHYYQWVCRSLWLILSKARQVYTVMGNSFSH